MRLVRGLLAGLAMGAAWGLLARCFMRLLAKEPEFSWEGTLLIVALGAFCGSLVGLVHGARVAGRSGWWRVAGLPALLLFLSPGLLLLPSTVGFALVLRGGRAARVAGSVLVAVSPVLATAPDPGAAAGDWLSGPQLAGLAVMTLAAGPLGWSLGELARPWPVASEAGPRSRPVGRGVLDPV